jgi:antitoxin (DNA-binding transcriptional repressor) of toxin-antitoxin stability system
MNVVSLQELARNPSLLDRVEAGEHIVVSRDNRPVAELRPLATASAPALRPYGLAAGTFVVPDEFDAALPDDILQEFEGR